MNLKTIQLLLKLKNAACVKKTYICIEYNIFILQIILLLYKQGFLQGFLILKKEQKIKVYIRYIYNFSFIQDIRIVSNISRKFFYKYKSICYIKDKKSMFCFSTSVGLCGLIDCKKQKIGGLLLFLC